MRRAIENFSALLVGMVIGTLGVVVHNFFIGWFPLGLLAALFGSVAASAVLGIRYGRRGVRSWFFLGWLLITLRAALFGNSDELLIMANGAGNTYLGLGFLLVLVSIWARL